ncbi:CHAT domain-containing tetratricopeptide repeat protein [Laspinema palackyanum]|uniref:CHAT domain-containing tetratricopeptide repeat protein n=1 Tax=Laspinema palackyanum TaxID=3231601 RepID=UPI00345D12F4|nr:CHAT domain-containing protein [Laspinema sp. D2c]
MFDNLMEQLISLHRNAETAYHQGQYEQGIQFATEACELGKYAFGENHPDYARILNVLAVLYSAMWRLTDAEPLFLQAMEIKKVQLGHNHPDYATSLDNLAGLYQDMGRLTDAEPLFLQAMEIKKVQLGHNHPDYANSLNNLAILYRVMGRFTDSESLYLQSMKIRKVQLGHNHPDYASSLNNLARLYRAMGRLTDSEPLYLQSMKIRKVQLGQNHPLYAESLNNLAELYRDMGRLTDAEPLYLQAMKIRKVQLGQNHPDYATSLNNLAILYRKMGRFTDSEPLYWQAIEIKKVQLGQNHHDYAQSLSNLAELYSAMGRLTDAEPLYWQAMEIQKVQLGENHPDYAASVNNLAELYRTMGRLTDAEPLLLQAIEICEVQLGQNHPHYASSLNNLGLLYSAMGRWKDAEPLCLQAKEIIKVQLGENHPDYATSLHNLAELYRTMGRLTDAERLFLQAKEIWKVQLGENHPSYARSLRGLAVLMAAMNRPHEALRLMQEANQITNRLIGEILSISSDRQRLEYMQQNYYHLEGFLSLITQYFPTDAAAKRAGLDLVLRRKGLATEAGLLMRTLIVSGRYPHLKPELEKLGQLTQQVGAFTLKVPTELSQYPAYQQQLARLKQEQEDVERSLSRQIPEMNLQTQLDSASREAITQSLPKGATLLEFVRVRVRNFQAVEANGDKQSFPARYLAFVLSAGDAAGVEMIDLGEAEEIDRLCRIFRQSVSGEEQGKKGDRDLDLSGLGKPKTDPIEESDVPAILTTPEGLELYQRLIQPLKAYLQPQQTLYIAPDGELATLPFGILSGDGTAYLMDEYKLRYLAVGRDLLRFQFPIPVKHTESLVIANPDYNLRGESGEDVAVTGILSKPSEYDEVRSLSRDLGRGSEEVFKPLPGTQIEGSRIAKLLEVPVYTQAQAVKSLLSRCHSPEIVHIATHGYFLPLDQTLPDVWGFFGLPTIEMGGVGSAGMVMQQGRRLQLQGLQDPMRRSGLAFAGANTVLQERLLPEQAEDGLLTAQNAVHLDLTGTRLVVMSACDTALGDQSIGEGVLGLRRSLILAGAETVVMSLWKVPDVPTAILMERFYHNLFETDLGRTVALEEAQEYLKTLQVSQLRQDWLTPEAIAQVEQLNYDCAKQLQELTTKPDEFTPFAGTKYWAAFVCIGNPSPFPKSASLSLALTRI